MAKWKDATQKKNLLLSSKDLFTVDRLDLFRIPPGQAPLLCNINSKIDSIKFHGTVKTQTHEY